MTQYGYLFKVTKIACTADYIIQNTTNTIAISLFMNPPAPILGALEQCTFNS